MTYRPRLRTLDARWTTHEGESVLAVSDRLGIMAGTLLAPPAVALLLSLCDGTNDLDAIVAGIEERGGGKNEPAHIQSLLDQLDEALVFDSPHFKEAEQALLDAFRDGPDRAPTHAGIVYPEKANALRMQLDRYAGGSPGAAGAGVRGIISPHIDYARGGALYGATWQAAAQAVRDADVVVIFGTDHLGSSGSITLTRLDYRTPFGVLPTDVETVDKLASVLGPGPSFAEEYHHKSEHSIELAAVWLHWVLQGISKPIIPILCGSFVPFTHQGLDPAEFDKFTVLIEELHTALTGKRVLAVAAADLAHVGPAFGDQPYTGNALTTLRNQDASLLETITLGSPARFFNELQGEQDERKVCGLPPIYLLLRYLGRSVGELVGYDQCVADEKQESWVSIAGVVLR